MKRVLCLIVVLGLGTTVPLRARASSAASLLRITLEPQHIVLQGKDARQQLLITGHYSDGSVRDLTATAKLSSSSSEVVRLDGSVLRAVGDGQATITTAFEGKTASLHVTVRRARETLPLSFRSDVMPILSRAGCNLGTCHGNFNGKNGFRLSLRGENPAFDFDSLTRDTQGRRACVFDPAASLVLMKPTGQAPHEGGIRFSKDSHEYATLRRWIAAGMPLDPPDAPRLLKLEAWPRERVLWHGAAQQQLAARGHFSDGSVRDLTHVAVFEPSSETVHVTADGVVHADKPCQVTVVVRYLDQRVPCRLAFVPERPGFQFPKIAAVNYVDEHLFARLQALQVEPSDLADDAVFLRRAYLDVCGVLPTPDEVKGFLADPRPDRRARLIDVLLERPEYAEFWASKWADLLRNEEKAVDAKGVRLFYNWLRQAMAADMPLDEFARTLLTARGSTYENPAANYYRTNLEPAKAAETTALLFMGVRIACAKCHNHPFDRWTQEDYHGLSAFFARIKTRIVDNQRKDKLDKHEFVGEMIVYLEREGEVLHPQTGQPLAPRLPGGIKATTSDADRLPALARWLTDGKNPFFARVMANRIWYHLMGRGLVDPVDDFRESNPPSNEMLLDALARDLATHQYSQKHLIRVIMNSRGYQLSSRTKPTNEEDLNFSRVEPRLLQAEVLLDAISQVTEVPETFAGHPRGLRAVQLPGVLGGPKFLKTFGRPDRLLACECERRGDTTLGQALTMINSDTILKKVESSPRVARLLEKKASSRDIITEFYLSALSRYPTAAEIRAISARLDSAAHRQAAVEDLLWAILNTKEFLLRR